jgi:hypothetical protein
MALLMGHAMFRYRLDNNPTDLTPAALQLLPFLRQSNGRCIVPASSRLNQGALVPPQPRMADSKLVAINRRFLV